MEADDAVASAMLRDVKKNGESITLFYGLKKRTNHVILCYVKYSSTLDYIILSFVLVYFIILYHIDLPRKKGSVSVGCANRAPREVPPAGIISTSLVLEHTPSVHIHNFWIDTPTDIYRYTCICIYIYIYIGIMCIYIYI